MKSAMGDISVNVRHENQKKDNSSVTPFEWITDCSSCIPVLDAALSSMCPARVLHVGSGSSVLGETIMETFGSRIEKVVNCDVDSETLRSMEKQWQAKHPDCSDNVQYIQTDFSDESKSLPFEDGYFHLVVDKGTMDCTLCSDLTTAGMLSEIYRLLDPNGGIYVLISFHHVDLLRPLLENVPGACWDVSHKVMQRQVEDLIGKNEKSYSSTYKQEQNNIIADENLLELMKSKGSGPWASGTFEPDEYYRRFANVFICRRNEGGQHYATARNCLDRHCIAEHVQQVNDDWFQLQNPMLTESRKQEICKLFQEQATAGGDGEEILCDLQLSYKIIFTEDERDHFTYDLFLEDWEAWVAEKNDDSFPRDKMSVKTAMDFLKAMQ